MSDIVGHFVSLHFLMDLHFHYTLLQYYVKGLHSVIQGALLRMCQSIGDWVILGLVAHFFYIF